MPGLRLFTTSRPSETTRKTTDCSLGSNRDPAVCSVYNQRSYCKDSLCLSRPDFANNEAPCVRAKQPSPIRTLYQMQSSNASQTGGATLEMPALSESLESTTLFSRSNTGDTAFSNLNQFNRCPKRAHSPRRVRSAPNLVVRMGSTRAPLFN